MITMIIVGLWHAASWTFIFWGGLHGAYLCINHIWRKRGYTMPNWMGWIITFLAVVFSRVFSRSENFETAFSIIKAMGDMLVPMGHIRFLIMKI